MQRSWRGMILCVVVMVGMLQNPASAQTPENQAPIGWDIGLVYVDGASEDNPFMLEEQGQAIQFWIRNDFLVDIEVALYFEGCNSDSEHNIVIVNSGSNDTFRMEFGLDPWVIESGQICDFQIRGDVKTLGPVPILTLNPSDEVEGELMVAELHRWDVHIVEIEHPISAGTEFNLKIHFVNEGNAPDSVKSITIEDDCPVLTADTSPLEDVTNQVVISHLDPAIFNGAEPYLSTTLVYDASSTHPTRMCNIEVTARSSGVANGGLGDTSNKDETEIEVKARPVGAQVDQEEASVGDGEEPDNPETVTSENFLPLHFSLTPLAIFSAALVRRKWSQTL
ncbi:MAG: hypothetical protein VYB40_05585 [Candidatus Thermoplasmatota archaeon]|nr:hypothetical protein [Candidatus Thermoplasmatota archaeon]